MGYFAIRSPANQVNGKAISRASLQEVLETLQSTGEQITLEVRRQKSAMSLREHLMLQRRWTSEQGTSSAARKRTAANRV